MSLSLSQKVPIEVVGRQPFPVLTFKPTRPLNLQIFEIAT